MGLGFNGQGAATGAMSGAAMGAAAGPWGAAIGGVVGGVAGGFMTPKAPQAWWDDGWFNDRRNQIEDFEKNLAGSRARYLTSLGNMYNQAYARFSGNAEAGFANRGLSVNGGAFASALARQTADYQAQMEPQAFQMEREDLGKVQDLYGGLFSTKVGAKSGAHNMNALNARAEQQSLGNFIGQLGMMGARAGMSNGSWGGGNKLGTMKPGSAPGDLGGYNSGSWQGPIG